MNLSCQSSGERKILNIFKREKEAIRLQKVRLDFPLDLYKKPK